MPDANEQDALTKIKAYLDAGHDLDAIRRAGWGEWVDHLEARSYDLRTGQLVIQPPRDLPTATNRTPREKHIEQTPEDAERPQSQFDERPPIVEGQEEGLRPDTPGGNIRRVRHGVGYGMIVLWSILNVLIQVAIYISLATGIWWPLTQAIIDNPVSVFWLVPLGLFITSISAMILRFIYGFALLIVVLPGGALTAWLLRDAEAS